FFFFFQAEDGIRDGHVTGVQTCALPIYDVTVITGRLGGNALEVDREAERAFGYRTVRLGRSLPMISNGSIARWSFGVGLKARLEIGRASCRERVWISGVGWTVRKKEERG